MKADTDAFKDQFKNKNVEKFKYTAVHLQKMIIDALSGATITTNAMTNGCECSLCISDMEGGAQ